MSGTWEVRLVGDCIEPLSAGARPTVFARDYRSVGKYPVVDQGQSLVAGRTDAAEAVIDHPLPVIVFGDHTRAVKFVDFPFARGADGTQVLVAAEGLDPQFLYYAIRHLDIPNRGYNRHFTLLKEMSVSMPTDPGEQQLIGRVLRAVETAGTVHADMLRAVEQLKAAVARTLFSRGLNDEPPRDTAAGPAPASWKEEPIGSLGRVVTGTTPRTKERRYYDGGDIPFVAPGDVAHGQSITSTQKHITPAGVSVSRPIPAGTTCVVCIGSSIGKVGLSSSPTSTTNQQINAVVPTNGMDPRFLFHLLTHFSDHIRRQSSPSPVPILSKGAFERICLPVSDNPRERSDIARIIDSIDAAAQVHRRKRDLVDELFKSLLHKLMTGEIRVSDLDLSALPSAKEATP